MNIIPDPHSNAYTVRRDQVRRAEYQELRAEYHELIAKRDALHTELHRTETLIAECEYLQVHGWSQQGYITITTYMWMGCAVLGALCVYKVLGIIGLLTAY